MIFKCGNMYIVYYKDRKRLPASARYISLWNRPFLTSVLGELRYAVSLVPLREKQNTSVLWNKGYIPALAGSLFRM